MCALCLLKNVMSLQPISDPSMKIIIFSSSDWHFDRTLSMHHCGIVQTILIILRTPLYVCLLPFPMLCNICFPFFHLSGSWEFRPFCCCFKETKFHQKQPKKFEDTSPAYRRRGKANTSLSALWVPFFISNLLICLCEISLPSPLFPLILYVHISIFFR